MHGQDLRQAWGNFAPETRKILQELQSMQLMNTAKQLAIAIDREYVLRNKDRFINRAARQRYQKYIKYTCKTCGEEFLRRPWGRESKEYCNNPTCYPSRQPHGEERPNAKLTWEQVAEMRHLYEAEHISQAKLVHKFGVSQGTVKSIVNYKTWKLEHDPRRKAI